MYLLDALDCGCGRVFNVCCDRVDFLLLMGEKHNKILRDLLYVVERLENLLLCGCLALWLGWILDLQLTLVRFCFFRLPALLPSASFLRDSVRCSFPQVDADLIE